MYADFLDIGKVKVNKDENVQRFALRAIRGELLERERGRERKKERERDIHQI